MEIFVVKESVINFNFNTVLFMSHRLSYQTNKKVELQIDYQLRYAYTESLIFIFLNFLMHSLIFIFLKRILY